MRFNRRKERSKQALFYFIGFTKIFLPQRKKREQRIYTIKKQEDQKKKLKLNLYEKMFARQKIVKACE